MRKPLIVPMLLLGGFLLCCCGCMPGGQVYAPQRLAGFFSGIWHGWIAPISLIVGLFDGQTRVYEAYNTGWWYDFGFYIAIISGFGGLSLVRRSRQDGDEDF